VHGEKGLARIEQRSRAPDGRNPDPAGQACVCASVGHDLVDYKVFRLTPKSPDQPNIILWITYKNMAALDKGIEEEAVAKKVICSTECQNKARVARSEYRKVLGSEYIRELVLK
jgi:hypothetical protein